MTAEDRGQWHWWWFSSLHCSWITCSLSPNSWPGVLFTAAPGGVLALSCHLPSGICFYRRKIILCFQILHVGRTCLFQLPRGCGVYFKMKQSASMATSPFCFLHSIFYLHAIVIDTLKRFPWHSNLTDIFSAAVAYFYKFQQSLSRSDNDTASLVIFQIFVWVWHSCHWVGIVFINTVNSEITFLLRESLHFPFYCFTYLLLIIFLSFLLFW